jgi:hypothetical protein
LADDLQALGRFSTAILSDALDELGSDGVLPVRCEWRV